MKFKDQRKSYLCSEILCLTYLNGLRPAMDAGSIGLFTPRYLLQGLIGGCQTILWFWLLSKWFFWKKQKPASA